MNWYFVCTGNICRSAFGQAYLSQQLQSLGSDALVTSGGTGINQALEPTDEIKEIGNRLGLLPQLNSHRPQAVATSVLEQQNIILGMTTDHRATLLDYAPHLLNRIFTLKEFSYLLANIELPVPTPGESSSDWWDRLLEKMYWIRSTAQHQELNVADPFRRSMSVYETCCEEILEAINLIVETEKTRISTTPRNAV